MLSGQPSNSVARSVTSFLLNIRISAPSFARIKKEYGGTSVSWSRRLHPLRIADCFSPLTPPEGYRYWPFWLNVISEMPNEYIEISFTLQHDAVSRILRSEGMPPLEFNNGSKTCQGYIPMWSNLLADRILPRVGPLAIYRRICDGVWRWVLAPGGFCCLSPVIALVTVVLATRVIWSQRAVCSRL